LEEFLKEHLADSSPGAKIRHEVEIGIPHKRIVEKAAEEGADLIVMSTHGRSGLFHMLIGSVTEKVVRRASCPVLSIHPVKESEGARREAGRDLTVEI
jgi:nucleotide-binding universal stress UspA family protein